MGLKSPEFYAYFRSEGIFLKKHTRKLFLDTYCRFFMYRAGSYHTETKRTGMYRTRPYHTSTIFTILMTYWKKTKSLLFVFCTKKRIDTTSKNYKKCFWYVFCSQDPTPYPKMHERSSLRNCYTLLSIVVYQLPRVKMHNWASLQHNYPHWSCTNVFLKININLTKLRTIGPTTFITYLHSTCWLLYETSGLADWIIFLYFIMTWTCLIGRQEKKKDNQV